MTELTVNMTFHGHYEKCKTAFVCHNSHYNRPKVIVPAKKPTHGIAVIMKLCAINPKTGYRNDSFSWLVNKDGYAFAGRQ